MFCFLILVEKKNSLRNKILNIWAKIGKKRENGEETETNDEILVEILKKFDERC